VVVGVPQQHAPGCPGMIGSRRLGGGAAA
jgi:hypothetical protein